MDTPSFKLHTKTGGWGLGPAIINGYLSFPSMSYSEFVPSVSKYDK